jgi:hypothetical protein
MIICVPMGYQGCCDEWNSVLCLPLKTESDTFQGKTRVFRLAPFNGSKWSKLHLAMARIYGVLAIVWAKSGLMTVYLNVLYDGTIIYTIVMVLRAGKGCGVVGQHVPRMGYSRPRQGYHASFDVNGLCGACLDIDGMVRVQFNILKWASTSASGWPAVHKKNKMNIFVLL